MATSSGCRLHSDRGAALALLAGLLMADDLEAAWNAPGVTMRARQRLLRALVTEIIADVDEAAREVVLTIHWRGAQHSQLGSANRSPASMVAVPPRRPWP